MLALSFLTISFTFSPMMTFLSSSVSFFPFSGSQLLRLDFYLLSSLPSLSFSFFLHFLSPVFSLSLLFFLSLDILPNCFFAFFCLCFFLFFPPLFFLRSPFCCRFSKLHSAPFSSSTLKEVFFFLFKNNYKTALFAYESLSTNYIYI